LSAVRIKPLEWSAYPEDGKILQEGLNERRFFRERALMPFGGAIFLMELWGRFSIKGVPGLGEASYEEPEAAKAAAQAKYEEKISAVVDGYDWSSSIRPLGRDELGEALRLLDEVQQALGGLPYRDAHPQLRNIEAIRGHLDDTLPGGFAGFCEGCEEPFGWDEIAAHDSEGGIILCAKCAPEPEDIAPLKADAEGWIKWTGGEQPVPPETIVEVIFGDGDIGTCPGPALAIRWRWANKGHGGDIIAYRVVANDATAKAAVEGEGGGDD